MTAEEKLTRVHPLKRHDLVPRPIDEMGPPPVLIWIPLKDLVIDHSYQRELTKASMRLIRKMVAEFDWATMKAINVVERGDGRFEVIDGQHTAVAAATHGEVNELPALVCEPLTKVEKARAFVGINTNRMRMSGLQVFWAEVAAGDDVSMAVVAGAVKGNARVLRSQPQTGVYKQGDTLAVKALKMVAKNKGKAGVAHVLRLGVRAKIVPITALAIKSFGHVLWASEYDGRRPSDDQIYEAIRGRWNEFLANSERDRLMNKVARFKALANQIVRECNA